MSAIFKRIFGKEPKPDLETVSWESRLSFEHAQIDRLLLKGLLRKDPEITPAQDFIADCLALDYTTAIPLHQEVDLLQRYVHIFQLAEERLHLTMAIELERDDLLIEPLVLFPLVQNAIQTTYFMSENRPIKCKIRLINHRLQMEVSNRVNPYFQNQSETECMRFFRSRLTQCYADKHDLLTNSNSNLFKATFQLELISPNNRLL